MKTEDLCDLKSGQIAEWDKNSYRMKHSFVAENKGVIEVRLMGSKISRPLFPHGVEWINAEWEVFDGTEEDYLIYKKLG